MTDFIQVTVSQQESPFPRLDQFVVLMAQPEVGASPMERTLPKVSVRLDRVELPEDMIRPAVSIKRADGSCNWCGAKAGPTRVVVQGAGMAICEDCVSLASAMIGSIETRRPV